MPKQMIEIDIPEGYEFDKYGQPIKGEYFLNLAGGISQVDSNLSSYYIILRKVWGPPDFLKPGWIVQVSEGTWWWHACEPINIVRGWVSGGSGFDLTYVKWEPPPCDNWQDSKRRIL